MESSNYERTVWAHKRLLFLPAWYSYCKSAFYSAVTLNVHIHLKVFQERYFSSEASKLPFFFMQWASIWYQSQTKHNPTHTAAPENRFADQTVSSVRRAHSIIDQLMPYDVLPSVINGIHKHYCWNYSTILLRLNTLQNTDHFPNITKPMITM